MAWTPLNPIALSQNWQYTNPVAGEYFRLKHELAPVGGLFAIAQAQFNVDTSIDLFGIQVFEQSIIPEIIQLKKPGYFSSRRLAVKRVTQNISLESEFRRLLRPALLLSPIADFQFVSRRNWKLSIEVSDYVELPTSGNTNSGPPGDPHFDKVVLLIHADGAQGSTNFVDVLGHAITTNGNAVISTAQSKFGGASGYFDGSGDYLAVSQSSNDFSFGTSDFTIELFAYCGDQPSPYGTFIGDSSNNNASEGRILFQIHNNKLVVLYDSSSWSSGVPSIISASAINNNAWNHLVFSRGNGIVRLFVNGILEASANYASNMYFLGSLLIGTYQYGITANRYYQGYIDELRITKGVARYTTNFVPPVQAFPNN